MYIPLVLNENRFLATLLNPILEDATGSHFTLDSETTDRKSADGLYTLVVESGGARFGVACSDFKSKGGSLGKKNAKKLVEFLRELRVRRLPLIFALDSMGARITEGRQVFGHAFTILPELEKFVRHNLLVTCNLGRALGIGAVVFVAGQYRMAVEGTSLTSLAGPEVLRLFFGDAHSFESIALAENQVRRNCLIHHLSGSKAEMLSAARDLVVIATRKGVFPEPSVRREPFPDLSLSIKPEVKLAGILRSISESATEVFGTLGTCIRTYLLRRRGSHFGLIVDLPGHSDNMITSRALERYILALDLFRAMKLPAISMLDTPGADPREILPENHDIVGKLWVAAQKVIEYPWRKMGIVTGRGYGAANLLGFPKLFGADRCYALEGASIGIMHPRIIEELLQNSKSLQAEWAEGKASQRPDFSDLVHSDALHGMLKPAEVPDAIDEFLRMPEPQDSSQIRRPSQEEGEP